MIELRSPKSAEMVLCIDGPMREERVIPIRTFFRDGKTPVVDMSCTPFGLAHMAHELVERDLNGHLGATLFVRSDGGEASVALAYEWFIDKMGPENVQAFSLDAASGAANTFFRAGHRFTTPEARVSVHAAYHRDTKKVAYDDRIKYMARWGDLIQGLDSPPELLARIRAAVFKDNWDDEMDDLPVDLTGADWAALGKVQLVPDAWTMQGLFNGFLPQAALDPVARGFWENTLSKT